MMKKFIYTILCTVMSLSAFAGVGIWQVGVKINGTDHNIVSNTGSTALGTVAPMGVVLNAGSASTWQNGSDDVCAVNTRYSVNAGTPINLTPLGYVSSSGSDKNWAITGQNVNLATLPDGMYTVVVYFDIVGKSGGVSCVSADNSTIFSYNSAGTYTITFTIVTPLPVAVTRFHAELSKSAVALSWNTASEINNSHFVVERSADGAQWAAIGEVEGAINAGSERNYTYLDTKPLKGKAYYRLAQMDQSGAVNYTKSVVVQKAQFMQVYPNPVADRLFVEMEEGATVHITNGAGQRVRSIIATESSWIDVADLPLGIYHIQCVDESGAALLNEKLLKI